MKYITTVTVRENQVALLFRDGVFVRQLAPGKQRFYGAGYEVKIFDSRWKEMQLQGQEFLTADKAQLRASALVKYRITDARLFEGVSENPLLVIYTAAQLGQAIGVILLERIIRTGGENGMLFWVFLITAAGNAMLFMLPAKTVVREQPKLAKVFGVLKSGRNKAVAFMQFASSFGFGVMMSSFADMVRSYYGILLVGTATIWFYVVRLFSSSFLGWLSDRWGRERILFLGFLLSAVGFTVVVFNHSLPAMYLAAGLLGFQFGTVPVAVMAMIGDETKPEERHLVFGGMFLWRDLGVAVAIISGMYINAFTRNYSVSFAIFAALFFVCAFLALRMKALPRKDSATVTTSATRR